MAVERTEIEALVRNVVTRTLGARGGGLGRPVLDEATVRATPVGATLVISPHTLITPLARQVAHERKITLQAPSPDAPNPDRSGSSRRVVAIGADHGGYDMKEALKAMLAEEYEVIDCGTHSKDAVDYPDIALKVARQVADGTAWRGIMIDGAGIGSCMVANKVRGVRAAMCYDQATAVNSREHNNANVLTLGAGLIGPALAQLIVRVWLSTDFAGGRHANRVAKIDALDGARPEFPPAAIEPKPTTASKPPAY